MLEESILLIKRQQMCVFRNSLLLLTSNSYRLGPVKEMSRRISLLCIWMEGQCPIMNEVQMIEEKSIIS